VPFEVVLFASVIEFTGTIVNDGADGLDHTGAWSGGGGG
jgi:hypothetical protein